MAVPRRAPAMATVVLLVLAAVTADDPATTLDVALSAEGQTPEPVSPAKLEASGESDLTTSAQRLGKGLTPLSFGGADDATRESQSSDSSSLDTPSSGSFSAEPLAGGPRPGPLLDGPAQSNESEEGLEHDADSEETLASQGI